MPFQLHTPCNKPNQTTHKIYSHPPPSSPPSVNHIRCNSNRTRQVVNRRDARNSLYTPFVLLHVSPVIHPLVNPYQFNSSISTTADQCAGTDTTAPLYPPPVTTHTHTHTRTHAHTYTAHIITKSSVDRNISSRCRTPGVL